MPLSSLPDKSLQFRYTEVIVVKKSAKAAVAATAVAALYGAAAYGVTRTLMDVAMKRDMPKALQHKSGDHLTGESHDELYREAQKLSLIHI